MSTLFLLFKPSLIVYGFEEKVVQNAGCQHNGIHFFRDGSRLMQKAFPTTFVTPNSI